MSEGLPECALVKPDCRGGMLCFRHNNVLSEKTLNDILFSSPARRARHAWGLCVCVCVIWDRKLYEYLASGWLLDL